MIMSHITELIKFYVDEKCSKQLPSNEEGNPLLEGKVVTAGQEEVREIWVKNHDTREFLVDEIPSDDKDMSVHITEDTLYYGKPVKIIVTFTPKEDRKDKLNAYFRIRGRFISR